MPLRAANAETRNEFPSELRTLEKAIRRIVRANDMQSRALAKACGLTSAQLVICKGVAELGEVTSAALSAYADISPATVVTILDNLEERGIIQRYRSLVDRRIVHTRLTEPGRAMMERAPEPLAASLVERMSGMDPAHRRAMVFCVDELSRLMERARPEPASPATEPRAE